MDEVKTASFTLGPSSADATAAVLLIHGFTGSPWEVRPLGEALAARNFYVRGIRLPGHGVDPEAMAWVTWKSWEDAARAALAAISGFRHVYVAGLSMGALLGMLLAAAEPEKVRGLALVAPVWKLRPWDGRILTRLRFLPLPRWTGYWVKKTGSDIDDADARADNPVLPRYPLARLWDLFTIQEHARAALPKVRCPSLVAAARHDHVVDYPSLVKLSKTLPRSTLLTLQNGFHIVPRDKDRAVLADAVASFFDGLSTSR